MDKLTCKIVEMESELRHFAFKLTADQDSANDLVQECMLVYPSFLYYHNLY